MLDFLMSSIEFEVYVIDWTLWPSEVYFGEELFKQLFKYCDIDSA